MISLFSRFFKSQAQETVPEVLKPEVSPEVLRMNAKRKILAKRIVDIISLYEGVRHTEGYVASAVMFHEHMLSELKGEEDVDKYVRVYIPASGMKKEIMSFMIENLKQKEENSRNETVQHMEQERFLQ